MIFVFCRYLGNICHLSLSHTRYHNLKNHHLKATLQEGGGGKSDQISFDGVAIFKNF